MIALLLAASLTQPALDVERLSNLRVPSFAFSATVQTPQIPSTRRLAVTFAIAGTPDWLITEYNVRQPGIEEANALGQSSLARAGLTAVYVVGATYLTREAYEISPTAGKVFKWLFVAYKAVLAAWNVRVLATR